MLLQIIDERWREHLHDMDYLREGIHLRGFAQIDPLVAYKNEGFEMFTGLMNAIWEEFGRYIFVVEVEVEGQNGDGARQPPAAAGAAAPTPARRPRSPTPAAPPTTSRARWPRRRRPAACPRRSRTPPSYAYDEVEVPGPVETRTSTRRTGSAATTRAGAARARSSRSAMAPSAARPPRPAEAARGLPLTPLR